MFYLTCEFGPKCHFVQLCRRSKLPQNDIDIHLEDSSSKFGGPSVRRAEGSIQSRWHSTVQNAKWNDVLFFPQPLTKSIPESTDSRCRARY